MKPYLLLLGLTLAGGPDAAAPEFRDIAADAGLTHAFPNGGMETKAFIIETAGSGVALIDYDNDGLLDAFVISGEGAPSRLYHNEGGSRFREVSESLGLVRTGWGQGVCAGDYDNDGFTDLFVTYWGQNALYRNESGRKVPGCYKGGGAAAEAGALQRGLRVPGL